MMFKMRLCILVFAAIFSSLVAEEVTNAEEITYEWLIGKADTGYTDHIAHFRELFNHFKVKTFLEFGLGYSTKYFLDSCSKVISVEFLTHSIGAGWFEKSLHLYQNYSHWLPIAYLSQYSHDVSKFSYKFFGSEAVHKANSYQCSSHQDYALIDPSYVKELDSFIGNLSKCYSIDCAFVDPGIYLRGDLVNLLFHRVPVIVVHDARMRIDGQKNDVYGYSRIVTPDNYEEILIPYGKGTVMWIRKECSTEQLLAALKRYVLNPNPDQ